MTIVVFISVTFSMRKAGLVFSVYLVISIKCPPKKSPLIWRSRFVKCKAQAHNLMFFDCQIDSGDFWGVRSTSKSQLMANSKLCGDSIMIFWKDPKSCTPTVIEYIDWHCALEVTYTQVWYIIGIYESRHSTPNLNW